ncbi:unnamed protein product [Ranitomeya imitator]|uniref:N-acetyltransferase domain-containing protein n=1 Tax=Ranitomeya imitator TaxID=111125 RepID=A0ABN9L104_9NEOB|nr:unnamed protein product [Ranitomeya imitator]
MLLLVNPKKRDSVLAVYMNDKWWGVDEVLMSMDPVQQGLKKVQTCGERIVLFVLNCLVCGFVEGGDSEDGVCFLPHSAGELAKIFWHHGEAVAFYTYKNKGNLYNQDVFVSFEQLRDTCNIPRSQFFRYLQLRRAVPVMTSRSHDRDVSRSFSHTILAIGTCRLHGAVTGASPGAGKAAEGSLCGRSSQCYMLPVLDTIYVRKKWRRHGFGIAMLKDFCQTFGQEVALGISSPLSPEMYHVCGRFLADSHKEQDRLWEVDPPGDWSQRANIWFQILLGETPVRASRSTKTLSEPTEGEISTPESQRDTDRGSTVSEDYRNTGYSTPHLGKKRKTRVQRVYERKQRKIC